MHSTSHQPLTTSHCFRRGVTLVELLLVIAIIALLVSLSIPAISASREAARRAQCTNNQRQYGIAFSGFEAQNKVFPSTLTAKLKGPLLGDAKLEVHNYVVDLLPFLEEKGVEAQYHRNAVFCAPENAAAIATEIKIAQCPSAPHDEFGTVPEVKFVPSLQFHPDARAHPVSGPILANLDKKYSMNYRGAVTDYAPPTGADSRLANAQGYKVSGDSVLESMFPPVAAVGEGLEKRLTSLLVGTGEIVFAGRIRVSQITDGLARTFSLTEVAGRPARWQDGMHTALGEPLPSAWCDPVTPLRIKGVKKPTGTCLMQCDNNGEIYSFHPDGVNFLFADGHVEFLDADTEPRLVLALMTPDGAEK